MPGLQFNTGANLRDVLTKEQEKEVRSLYANAANDVRRRAEALKGVEGSAPLKEAQLKALAAQLDTAQNNISRKLGEAIPNTMQSVAEATIKDSAKFLNSVGMGPIQAMYSHVPENVVNAIISGQVYKPLENGSNWSLSSAIWGDNAQTHKDINTIIAEGIASNKSTYDIAKALENYVSPSAKKPWDWAKVYPGTKKQVDYNAQRLARTMVSHAYQVSFLAATRPNPMVSGYIWHSAHSDRVCPICQDLDGQFFKKEEMPMDHPNGMCHYEAVIPPLDEVADRIADWYNGSSDSELDTFARSLFSGYSDIPKDSPSAKEAFAENQTKPDVREWLNKLVSNKEDAFYKSSKDWVEYLTEEERQAIRDYTDSGYLDYNKQLRENDGYPGEYAATIKEINDALETNIRSEDVYAARGIDSNALDALFGQSKSLDDIVGAVFRDEGFVSTTVVYNEADDNFGTSKVIMRIPPEINGAYVERLTANPSEFEFLVQPGTSWRVVEAYEKDGFNYIFVEPT